jgi:hypothetical protein
MYFRWIIYTFSQENISRNTVAKPIQLPREKLYFRLQLKFDSDKVILLKFWYCFLGSGMAIVRSVPE